MQVYALNSNSQKQSFSGGINHNVLKKVMQNGGDFSLSLNKAEEINCTNNPNFIITDVFYNAKDSTAEFILSVCDKMKFVPGMENIKPQSVISKGKNIAEAFYNIDTKKLKLANETLDKSYKEQFKSTENLRETIYQQWQKNIVDLQNRFDNFRSFWTDYYRQIRH